MPARLGVGPVVQRLARSWDPGVDAARRATSIIATYPGIVYERNDTSNRWDVRHYQGYLFTGDLSRGMDVFELAG